MRRYGQMDFDTFDILMDYEEPTPPEITLNYDDSAFNNAGLLDLKRGKCHSFSLCSNFDSSEIGFLEFVNPLDVPIIAKLDFSTSIYFYSHELEFAMKGHQEPIYILLERYNIHNQRTILGSWIIEKPLPKNIRGGLIDYNYSEYFSFTLCDNIPSKSYVIYKVVSTASLNGSDELIILNPEITALFSEKHDT